VAKTYAICLALIAHKTIDRSQTAFIKGRCLHGSVLALHEIVHELWIKNLGALFFKLKFKRAYARVNRDFLREIPLGEEFLSMGGRTNADGHGRPNCYQCKWRNLDFCHDAQGVCQGDPLSPILFNFTVDGLAAMLFEANVVGHI
jgi:hypothetical protein